MSKKVHLATGLEPATPKLPFVPKIALVTWSLVSVSSLDGIENPAQLTNMKIGP